MSPIWEWIIGAIARFLLAFKLAAAGIVGRVFATFGLTMISFNTLLPQFQSFVQGFASGLPAQAMEFLAAVGIGKAMSMVFSALTVRMAWRVFVVPTSVVESLGGGGQ